MNSLPDTPMPNDAPELENFFDDARGLIAGIRRVSIAGLKWSILSEATMPKFGRTIQEAKEAVLSFQVINESTIVETEDGYPLVVFIKNGLSKCFPKASTERLQVKVETSIKKLTATYKPKVPSKGDDRHREGRKEEMQNWATKGLPWGLYHFAFWYEQGHQHKKEPGLSVDIRKANASSSVLVKAFLEAQAPIAQAIGMWFLAIDPDTWARYNELYQRLANEGKLGVIHQSSRGCYVAMALLINTAVNPHRDPGDVTKGWVTTNCWGQFEGGMPAFGGLDMLFQQKPMDLMFARSALIEHWVTPITSGERFCQTHFVKKDIMDKLIPKFFCDYCDTKSVYHRNIQGHLRNIVRDPTKLNADGAHDIAEIMRKNRWGADGTVARTGVTTKPRQQKTRSSVTKAKVTKTKTRRGKA